MKHLYLSLIFAQCIYGQIVSQCPLNTQLGSTISVWDWTTETYDLYILEDNSTTVHITAPSPFHTINYSLQENTAHLAFSQELDNDPADGWELVYRNFGTQQVPVAEPSYALYNRNNGLLRTFIWLTANEGNTYQAARLDMKQSIDAPFTKNSAVFSAVNAPVLNALDDFIKDIGNTAINSYAESVGTWIVSEVTLMYDPCSCLHNTAIRNQPSLTSLTEVNLDIVGSSLTVPIYSGGSNNAGSNLFTGILNTSDDIATLIKEGNAVYKDLDAFSKFLNKLFSVTNPETEGGLDYLLPDWLVGSIPGVGAVLNVLDLLISGGSNPTARTVSAYATNYNFEVTGELTTIAPYQPNLYYTPGADHQGLPSSNIPAYDNVPGVFNLLYTPILKTTRVFEYEAWQTGEHRIFEEYSYRLDERSVKAVYNTTIGLGLDPENLRASLILRRCDGSQPEYYEVQGLTPTGLTDEFRSPFMPISCLAEYTIRLHRLDEFYETGHSTPPVDIYDDYFCDFYLRIVTTLDGGGEVSFIGTYNVDFEEAEYTHDEVPENPHLGIPEIIVIEYDDFIQGGEFIAWHGVVVTNTPREISITTEDIWDIYTPEVSFYDPEGELFEPSIPEFTINSPFPVFCPVTLPADQNEIDDFCSNIYNPNVRSPVVNYPNDKNPIYPLTYSYSVYPNPVVDFVNVRFPNKPFEVRFMLLNQLGQRVKETVSYPIDGMASIDLRDIPSGLYTLLAHVDNSSDGTFAYENSLLLKH